jgi:lysylphosphatidylglycerol synthetase-like protein (DUF2156 family)
MRFVKKISISTLSSIVSLFFLPINFVFAEQGLVACTGTDCTWDTFFLTLSNVMTFALEIAVIFSVIVLVYAGYTYLIAFGNETKIKTAHNMLTNAVVGFLIALSAWFIVDMILKTLGANFSLDDAKQSISGFEKRL